MTERDFLNYVIANNANNDEVAAFAADKLAKLDARNDKRRNTLTKEQIANEEIKKAIVEFVGEGTKVASEIANALGISTQKVSALAKQLIDNGTFAKSEVAVRGKGKVIGYSKVG